jgi:serine/threonine protein kinase
MNPEGNNVMQPKSTQPPQVIESDDYAVILQEYGLAYTEIDFYLQVGKASKVQGWILHVSVIWPRFHQLLHSVVPILLKQNVSFKIPRNRNIAELILNGNLGYAQLGKIITIYSDSDEQLIDTAKNLIQLTGSFRGPAIPTDFHLGGLVYTRYGSFNALLYADNKGKTDKYIYDTSGGLIKDTFGIPFQMPRGINWPFEKIVSLRIDKTNSFLKNTYKVVSTIKSDAKGRVLKALRLRRFRVEWCIIKEGKHDMYADEAERDIQDRLRWQYSLQQELYGKLPVPAVYDTFTEVGNTYFVMEFVRGTSLQSLLASLCQDRSWRHVSLRKRMQLIDYLLQLVSIIEVLHKNGYVHRDLTPVNFILDSKGSFVMIDMELAYSFHKGTPSPPFKFGTDGYMSPEQCEVQIPSIKEDIYGFGALMIVFFTNLSPIKFGTTDQDRLLENLNFFIRNETIAGIIVECLKSDGRERPELSKIKKVLEACKNDLVTGLGDESHLNEEWETNKPSDRHVIQESVDAFNSPLMRKPDKVWHSNLVQDEKLIANRQKGTSYYFGLNAGVSGVMYALARAKENNFDTSIVSQAYKKSHDCIRNEFLQGLPNVVPGLYSGAAGVALAVAVGMESGILERTNENIASIELCLTLPIGGLDLADGVAGQGLAVLNCLQFLEDSLSSSLLKKHVDTLITHQQNDGSWLSVIDNGDSKFKVTGLAHGVAGITCFLLEYYHLYKDPRAKYSVEKALAWLDKQSRKVNEATLWSVNNRDKITNPGLNEGVAGVAFSFIKAYEVLRVLDYRQIAERALNYFPHYAVGADLSHADGITGIGEVYLEAQRVFGTDKWRERARWIADMLIHIRRYQSDGSCYWVVDDNKFCTGDLMTGNGGVLHFLIHNKNPDTFASIYSPRPSHAKFNSYARSEFSFGNSKH